MKLKKANLLWLFYAGFLAAAIITHHSEGLFFSDGPYSLGKPLIWLTWAAFLAYTIHVNKRENFFKTMVKLNPFLWHRQIGIDLYIGLLVPLFLIYLNEGSFLVTLLWFLPIFIFANLATLPYLALNYDSLIAHFL